MVLPSLLLVRRGVRRVVGRSRMLRIMSPDLVRRGAPARRGLSSSSPWASFKEALRRARRLLSELLEVSPLFRRVGLVGEGSAAEELRLVLLPRERALFRTQPLLSVWLGLALLSSISPPDKEMEDLRRRRGEEGSLEELLGPRFLLLPRDLVLSTLDRTRPLLSMWLGLAVVSLSSISPPDEEIEDRRRRLAASLLEGSPLLGLRLALLPLALLPSPPPLDRTGPLPSVVLLRRSPGPLEEDVLLRVFRRGRLVRSSSAWLWWTSTEERRRRRGASPSSSSSSSCCEKFHSPKEKLRCGLP